MSVEIYRGIATAADCDHLGHMNLGRFFAICGDGMFGLQARVGLTRDDIESGRRQSFAVVHVEADFLSEVRVGESIVVRTTLDRVGGKSATFRHHMTAGPPDRPVFEVLFRAAYFDLATRRAAEIPADVRSGLERLFGR